MGTSVSASRRAVRAWSRRTRCLATACVVAVSCVAAGAQEEPPLGWTGSAELSLLATRGNSETSSLGLRATGTRNWEEARLSLEAAALQAEQSRVERRVVGPPEEPVLVETEESETTADNYSLGATYDRNLSERLLAFGSGGWERDELAGIANRASVVAGLGHVWADSEVMESRTRYGIGYTWEELTSDLEDQYLNLRLGWSFRRLLTETTTFTSELVVDENLEDTSDYRGDLLASVAVTMTERLALKVSGQARYDNEPAQVEVPRELPAGTPTGDVALVELEELDTVLSAALVLSW